jgi:membrane protease YdiL (CAAX protease family)
MDVIPVEPQNQRSIIQRIFISPEVRRLRAGWRLLIMTAFNFLLTLILSTPFGIYYVTRGDRIPIILIQCISLISITVTVFLSRRFLDKRSITSLGLDIKQKIWQDLFTGILFAGIMLGIVFFIEWLFGFLTIEGFAWGFQPWGIILKGILGSATLFIMTGWIEELQFRGYYLQNLADGINITWAVVLSSLWFAAMHLLNPNASLQIIPGLFISGIIFAYSYLRTRQLWLAIGIHIGWNFFEGTIYGFQVSGLEIYRLTIQNVQGPELITGGGFGPEAGLVLFPAIAIGFSMIYFYTKNRKLPKSE